MDQKEKKAFSFVSRAKSFTHATRGIWLVFKTQHNVWVEGGVSIVALLLGVYFSITAIEWCLLLFSIALVISLEVINTAIEIDMDLTSPEFHPFARDTKDVAAGAVFFASIFALLIGCIIFIPKIMLLI